MTKKPVTRKAKNKKTVRTHPREFTDLPYSRYLEPFNGDVMSGDSYDSVHVDELSFDQCDMDAASFFESAFSSVTFNGGHGRQAKFKDVWANNTRWMGMTLPTSDWLDVEVVSNAFIGASMPSALMRRVAFFDCKLDTVNFRESELREVSFINCVLHDVDFASAELIDVTFSGSTMDDIRFDRSRLRNVDVSDAVSIRISSGYDALNGLTIGPGQLLDMASAFAAFLGVKVKSSD